MTMKTKLLICLAALLGVAALEKTRGTAMPKARFTVRVLSEDKSPMEGATVRVVFMDPVTHDMAPQEGRTGADGLFVAEGHTTGSIAGGVTREGFYRSGWPGPRFNGLENGRWQPWDETYTTYLRPVINPVPMYARSGWIEIPAVNQPCGYDLQEGDWVKPHGKGTTSDLVFTLNRQYQSRQNFDVRVAVTFQNKLDGIQVADMPVYGRSSEFKWLREAPASGYETTLETWFKNNRETSYQQSANDEQMYFFRVRTVEQNGRIVSALYGKIKGGLQLAPSNSKTCKVALNYCLNPTPLDRNMEWDPKRNLITGLSWEENPREP